MKYLFILNDAAYGTERSYNALRLAMNLQKQEPESEVCVLLMDDAVICAKAGQKTPNGCYNLERMLKAVGRKGEVLPCDTCMDARAMTQDEATGAPAVAPWTSSPSARGQPTRCSSSEGRPPDHAYGLRSVPVGQH